MILHNQTWNKISQQYDDPIKFNRIKKQVDQISKFSRDNILINKVQLIPFGIQIIIHHIKNKLTYKFQLRIDNQYPFTRPQLVCFNHQNAYSASDLFDQILKEGEVWGPSKKLIEIIQQIPSLTQRLEKGKKLLGKYNINEKFTKEQLIQKGLKLFEASEIVWNLFIRTTNTKIIALSSNVFLKFAIQKPFLKLELCIQIRQIKEITTNKQNKELYIKYITLDTTNSHVLHLVNIQHLNQIMQILNPVDLILKRVGENQKKSENNNQLILDYKFLINYYEERNPELHKQYMVKFKGLTKNQDLVLQQL